MRINVFTTKGQTPSTKIERYITRENNDILQYVDVSVQYLDILIFPLVITQITLICWAHMGIIWMVHIHYVDQTSAIRERSGSVVECLTRDRWAADSSLTSVTALWALSKTHYPSLVLVQPRKTRPYLTDRLLMGRKESNQTNNISNPHRSNTTLFVRSK